MLNFFDGPGRIDFGAGALNRLPDAVHALNGKHVLLITDPGIMKIGLGERAMNILKTAGISYTLYDQVLGEPTDVIVKDLVAHIKDSGADLLVALGGGSTIDATKAANIVARNGGEIEDYEGVDKAKLPGLPLIAVPTTAGTGSEVENTFIINSLRIKRKMVLVSMYAIPTYTICDPELTLTLPPKLTLGPGMDALAHAMESYLSKLGNPITEIHALKAMNLIYNNLAECVNNGSNLEARTNQMLGSILAGIAMSNSGCGVCHAVTAPLGAYFHITHGDANAMCLPQAMKFNAEAVPEKMVEMGVAMGMGTADTLTADDVVENIFKLARACNMPSLTSYGVTIDKIDENFITEVVQEFSATCNPREIKREDVIPFIEACM
jgi:alcohol dehydrogenase